MPLPSAGDVRSVRGGRGGWRHNGAVWRVAQGSEEKAGEGRGEREAGTAEISQVAHHLPLTHPSLNDAMFTAQCSPPIAHRSPLTSLHSPLIPHHSPLATFHFSRFTSHSSLTTHHSPPFTHHSFTRHPPRATRPPPLITIHLSRFLVAGKVHVS
jgi:hypothetical protein